MHIIIIVTPYYKLRYLFGETGLADGLALFAGGPRCERPIADENSETPTKQGRRALFWGKEARGAGAQTHLNPTHNLCMYLVLS